MGLLAFGDSSYHSDFYSECFGSYRAGLYCHTVHYGDFASESRAKADETARNHLRDSYIYLCFSACHPWRMGVPKDIQVNTAVKGKRVAYLERDYL